MVRRMWANAGQWPSGVLARRFVCLRMRASKVRMAGGSSNDFMKM